MLAVALVVAVSVGLLVGYKMIRSNYYVGADNGSVVILRGLPGSVLGYSIHDVNQVGCVTKTGELSLVNPGADLPSACKQLKVTDLKQTGREQVGRGLPPGSLDRAKEQMRSIAQGELLPPCPVKESVPQPGVLPQPADPQPPLPPATSSVPTTTAEPPPGPGDARPTPTKSEAPVPPSTTSSNPQIAGENCRVTD
ncbi:hypothetical protein ACWIG5_42515 [Streptomyces lydicus]